MKGNIGYFQFPQYAIVIEKECFPVLSLAHKLTQLRHLKIWWFSSPDSNKQFQQQTEERLSLLPSICSADFDPLVSQNIFV